MRSFRLIFVAALLELSLSGCTMAYGGSNVIFDYGEGDASEDDSALPTDPFDDAGTPDTRRPKSDTGTGSTKPDTAAPDTFAPGPDTASPPPIDSGVDSGSSLDSSSTDPLEPARAMCVDEINAYRATLGLPPYARDASSETCADGQSKSDSASGTAHGAFGKCSEWAQNECPGWPGTADSMIKGCLKMMWDEGPGSFSGHGHYINMSSKTYKTVFCGFYKTSSGDWWSVQDFR